MWLIEEVGELATALQTSALGKNPACRASESRRRVCRRCRVADDAGEHPRRGSRKGTVQVHDRRQGRRREAVGEWPQVRSPYFAPLSKNQAQKRSINDCCRLALDADKSLIWAGRILLNLRRFPGSGTFLSAAASFSLFALVTWAGRWCGVLGLKPLEHKASQLTAKVPTSIEIRWPTVPGNPQVTWIPEAERASLEQIATAAIGNDSDRFSVGTRTRWQGDDR